MKKKILITGASGMLGAYLALLWSTSKKYDIFATGKSFFSPNSSYAFKQFDLQEKTYRQLSHWTNPDIIIHCAALTNMDYCEKNKKEAMLINGESVRKLNDVFPNAKLIFLSTDAVLPVNFHLATERISTNPSTVYGKSKELGEKYLQAKTKNGLIIRTTIVGKNLNCQKQSFVEWIVYSLKKKKEITLFEDVLFTPITIWHFASELEWLIENQDKTLMPNILHIAGSELTSKYDFGFRLCKKLNLDNSLMKKGQLNDMKSNVSRSHDQSLDISLYESLSQRKLPDVPDTIQLLVGHFSA